MLRAIIAVASFASWASAGSIVGTATYTGGTLHGGTCSFSSYEFPVNVFGTGIGPQNWNSGGLCGACLQIDGPRGSVKVMITDSCPSCGENNLNLYAEGFERIADPNDGIVDVTFDPVSCGISTPIRVRNKEGTSRWFFSMQVVNANYPVIGMDVSNDDGNTWQETVRQDYNYFEKDGKGGFDKDNVYVRITCSNQNQVVIPNVSMESEMQTVAPVNC